MTEQYKRKPVNVTIGRPKVVELPLRVFRARVTGFLFDTDKCFVLPGALLGVKEIKRFYDDHPGLELLINGHADRTGSEAHNLMLSEQRAASLAAFLQDKVDDWMPWYSKGKPTSQRWGVREDQHMLSALGYYKGPIHGKDDDPTRAAVNAVRGSDRGPIDEPTRRILVEKYMKIDETTLPAGTKVVTHGCGEFHPLEGGSDAENRRVEVFFFEGAIQPSVPTTCRQGGCSQYAEWKKHLAEDFDLCVRRDLLAVTVTLRNYAAELIEGGPYRMKAGDQSKHGRSASGQVTLQVPPDAERCLVEWGREGDPDLAQNGGEPPFRIELHLHYEHGSDEEQARMRLHNLGYLDSQPFDDNVTSFQLDHELEPTGTLDDETRSCLIDVHGTLARPVKQWEGSRG
jgi:outer membrane protein OmpA-like peptidoglycan-associated protein